MAAVSSPPGHISLTGAPNILAGRKFFSALKYAPGNKRKCGM